MTKRSLQFKLRLSYKTVATAILRWLLNGASVHHTGGSYVELCALCGWFTTNGFLPRDQRIIAIAGAVQDKETGEWLHLCPRCYDWMKDKEVRGGYSHLKP